MGGVESPHDELADLEAEEKRVSEERRRLHQQIDNGFATETTRTHERDVSQRRRELHQQIDALRERLGLPVGPRPSPGRLENVWPALGSAPIDLEESE
jgi:hypothetical protein